MSEAHNVNKIHSVDNQHVFMHDNEFVGIYEIAEIAKVSPAAVGNWRRRYSDFPKPIADLKSGPVFQFSQITSWLRKRRTTMTSIISVINLKGGVGKSTTTAALAEMLAANYKKKVLAIDLDPQTNLTTMLIGEDKWKDLNKIELTLARLFKDALEPNEKKFDLQKTLQRGVSNVNEVRTLDLLPSSLDLIDVQDRIASMPTGQFYAGSPIDILRKATKPLIDEYDIVLIDCPPNLGIITLNGLRMSMGYIIPTIPDVLSTYGIPQIVKRVSAFSNDIAEDIEAIGIIVSKYRAQSTVHNNTLSMLKHSKDAQVFKTIIPENNQIAAAAEYTEVSTLRQKWGYQGQFDYYKALAEELIERIS